MSEAERIVLRVKDYLLQSPAKRYILKIILFGSQVKKEASKNSDIDLLLVIRGNRDKKKAEDIVNEALYEAILETGAPIEPLICSAEEAFWPDNYFIYNILSYGKEVFSIDKQTLKEEAIKGLIELSREYLISSEESAKVGHLRLAIDGAYNSVELIVKAFLLKRLDDLPGSHGGILTKFGELYIKGGELERSIGRSLSQALQLRNWARYRYDKIIEKKDFEFVHDLAKTLQKAFTKIYNTPFSLI
jgi:uncharacterized protein (UPF0332 family)/predicted nucleotidyltransferase